MLGGVLLGLQEPHLLFDVIVHGATLLATVIFYWPSFVGMGRDLVGASRDVVDGGGIGATLTARPDARLLLLIVVGSVPTALIGGLFKQPLEALFIEPKLAAGMLLVTAAVLLATRFAPKGTCRVGDVALWQVLIIGLVQGFAIIPGISRSGSTIACALLLGFDRELAARYSFLLSVPAVLGAVGIVGVRVLDGGLSGIGIVPLVVGFTIAAAVGVGALALLIPLVRRGRLHWFSPYLVVAGITGLAVL